MKLSTYIGLRTIGWIITENNKVVKYGIKRLSIPHDHYYEFISGNPITAMINRRLYRGASRNIWRSVRRRKKLEKYLNSLEFFIKKIFSKTTFKIKNKREKTSIDKI